VATTSGRTFEVKFLGDISGLTKSFRDIEKHGKAVGNTFGGITKSISDSMMTTGKSLTRNVTVPLAAVGAAIFKTTQAASGLAEAQSKVTAVFGDQAKEVLDWGKTTATSLGISSRAALGAAGTYGNLFRAFGIGLKQSQQMSMRLVELAADMASFNDVPIDDALNALRSGLSGETEPLKRFGVALNEVRLKEEARRIGLGTYTGMLPLAVKSQAAYSLILKDTALQQGDVERTSGGLAAQQKFLAAQMEDTTASFGAVFTPVLINLIGVVRTQVLPQIQKFVGALQGLSPEALATAVKIGLIAAAIGPALIAISYLIKGLQALATAILFVTKKIVLIPLVILAVVSSLNKSADATMTWGEAIYTTIRQIVGLFASLANGVISAINFIIRAINSLMSGWNSLMLKAHQLGKVLGTNNSEFKQTGSAISEITWRADGLTAAVDSAYDGFNKFTTELAKQTEDLSAMANEAKALGDQMSKAGESVNGGGGKSAKGVKKITDAFKAVNALIPVFKERIDSATSSLDEARQKFNDYAKSISGSITGYLKFNADTSGKTFFQNLSDQAQQATSFAQKVQQLIALGLSESGISQVLAAGADAGSKIADEIIAGGTTMVSQINTMVDALKLVADQTGLQAAEAFYRQGITLGEQMVAGIVEALKASGLSIQGTDTSTITNQSAVAYVNKQLAKARKSGGKLTKKERTAIEKLAAELGVAVPAMAKGGIVNKPTLALIGEAGPEAVVPLNRNNMPMGNTINLTVNAGMGADGNQIGREIVDAIKRYERTSGPVFKSA
jgi:hypothetical protein